MSDRPKYRPFTGDSSGSVRLEQAPLELVLCQIRWPELMHLQGDLKPIALKFGSTISDYPLFSQVQEMGFNVTPEGVQQQVVGTIFQWSSIDGEWHVSFSRRFASFYCTSYESFTEFSDRLASVLEAVGSVDIGILERIGVRYVNRISDRATIDDLSRLVRPEVLGYQALGPIASGVSLRNSVNQAVYAVDDAVLQVRSGMVPPGESVDPSVKPLNRIVDSGSGCFHGRAMAFHHRRDAQSGG